MVLALLAPDLAETPPLAGSKVLEVVHDRNDVAHIFRYSVYQTGFLGMFIFKLQGIWKFSSLDSARTKWTFRFRLVPKNRLGNVVVSFRVEPQGPDPKLAILILYMMRRYSIDFS